MYGAHDPSIAGIVLDNPFSNLNDFMMELVNVYKIRLPKFTVSVSPSSLIRHSYFHKAKMIIIMREKWHASSLLSRCQSLQSISNTEEADESYLDDRLRWQFSICERPYKRRPILTSWTLTLSMYVVTLSYEVKPHLWFSSLITICTYARMLYTFFTQLQRIDIYEGTRGKHIASYRA